MNSKDGFKLVESIFQQFEEIPNYWEFCTLQKLEKNKKSIRMGPFGSSLKKEELVDSGIMTLWIENIVKNEFSWEYKQYITEKKFQELKAFKVEPDDVLMTMMGTIGKVAIVPKDIGDAIITSHLLKITLDEKKCLPNYLYYFLQSHFVYRQLIRESRGVVMGGLNTEIIKNLLIKVPPIPEQEKIISILSKIDLSIKKQQQVIKETQELKKSQMMKLLTSGIKHDDFKDPRKGHNPYQLKSIPKDWTYPLMGSEESGIFKNGLNKEAEDYGQGVLHVNINDIFKGFKINTENLGRVNATEKELEVYRLEKNDILMLRSSVKLSGVGYPALFEDDSKDIVYSGFIIRFRPKEEFWDSVFLTYLLQSEFIRNNVIGWATQSANTNINQESLREIPLPHPEKPEQQKIGSMLSNLDALINHEKQTGEKLKQIKKGTIQQLLTGQIKVKV